MVVISVFGSDALTCETLVLSLFCSLSCVTMSTSTRTWVLWKEDKGQLQAWRARGAPTTEWPTVASVESPTHQQHWELKAWVRVLECAL